MRLQKQKLFQAVYGFSLILGFCHHLVPQIGVLHLLVTLASRSRIPDQLKWAEYIGVSIVAQFLLFPHVEGEVLEGNLLSGVDCVIQGFHDVIDFLVAGIDVG